MPVGAMVFLVRGRQKCLGQRSPFGVVLNSHTLKVTEALERAVLRGSPQHCEQPGCPICTKGTAGDVWIYAIMFAILQGVPTSHHHTAHLEHTQVLLNYPQ